MVAYGFAVARGSRGTRLGAELSCGPGSTGSGEHASAGHWTGAPSLCRCAALGVACLTNRQRIKAETSLACKAPV